MRRRCTSLLILIILFLTTNVSYATAIVAVLFDGFSASSGSTSGMDTLSSTLTSRFGTAHPTTTFSSRVFRHFEQQQAFNYINSFNDICCLVLVGHSLGGDSVIELANDFLLPRHVDLTVQIDSVGIGDDVLPTNVGTGFNYFQISTGLFEPQGELVVLGATNINVETLFSDPTITHTSIDDDSRLHNAIFLNIEATCVPEPSSLAIFLSGVGIKFCYRRRQKCYATA